MRSAVESVYAVRQTVGQINLVLATENEIIEQVLTRFRCRKPLDQISSPVKMKQFRAGAVIGTSIAPDAIVKGIDLQAANGPNIVPSSGHKVGHISVFIDPHNLS